VQRLEATQVQGNGNSDGGWSYPNGNFSDNSNAQFAILGLREAAVADIPVHRDTWERAKAHWLKTQNDDGGWSYIDRGSNSTGSMTAAGISSLVIIEDMMSDKKYLNDDGTLRCCGDPEVNQPLERGIQWMDRNFSAGSNPREARWVLYYLYGIERAGRLSGKRFFGKHDCYLEGAEYLLRQQNVLKGYLSGTTSLDAEPIIGTSLVLLFLSKGLSPVLINKLKFGPVDKRGEIVDINWNLHPNDVRNLTERISGLPKWPKLLTWQVVDSAKLGADGVKELLQAPIVYLSGADTPVFSDPQKIALLREYVNQGGFIFAVANCKGAGFDTGFRDLVTKMFPNGEAQLKPLPPDHPVYRAENNLSDEPPELHGVDFGCRTAIIYAPDDWSCLWDKATRHDPPGRTEDVKLRVLKATRLGVNVVAYATGRELQLKLHENVRETEKNYDIERGLLEVAKLRHTGAWDAAPQALRNLLMALNKTSGLIASTKQQNLPASDPNLFNFPVVYMHGKNRFQLSKPELEQLRKYLDRGGVLIADACCGSKPFDTSFRDMVEGIYPDKKLEPIPADHEMFTAAVGFDIHKVKRRVHDVDRPEQAMVTAIREGEPQLEGIKVDDRYSIIYSRYDISCALEKQGSLACAGYVEEDAVKIGVNLIRYALLQDISYAEKMK
jgi:hypothetical protein